MDSISKLIKDVGFPSAGDLFAVICKPIERDVESVGGTVERVVHQDRSYRDRVFRCIASDASRVVATTAHGYDYFNGKPHIFYRPDYQFDDVSLIASALGLNGGAGEQS